MENQLDTLKQARAWQAARLGETLIAAARANQLSQIEALWLPDSPAALLFQMFGLAWLRLDLRLDDPREAGQLAPYDLQIEADVALLELGVVTRQPTAEAGGGGHLLRLFGSGLLLRPVETAEFGWLVEEVLPVNTDGALHPGDPADERILQFHQGRLALPLRSETLDAVEQTFLAAMQEQAGHFNIEELLNARQLWQDFRATEEVDLTSPGWAAAIEYLITLFDYHQAALETLAARYSLSAEVVSDQAREIAAALRVTQFDDRYSVHPDPVSHYRQLFNELGIDPRRDEEVRQAAGRPIFDSIEMPPDDDTFFGPR